METNHGKFPRCETREQSVLSTQTSCPEPPRSTFALSNQQLKMQQPATTNLTPTNLTLATTPQGAHILPPQNKHAPHFLLDVRFSEQQLNTRLNSLGGEKLKHAVNGKVRRKEYFYGIEILARSYNGTKTLDFNSLGQLMPLFTSIVWLSLSYLQDKNMEENESVQLANKLHPHTHVMPHFACYGLKEERLMNFLNQNFTNILAVRGDLRIEDQAFKHSSELVEAIRKHKGDDITIGVAGYPDGHPESSTIEEDLMNLRKKVSAGADMIITQICFSSQSIIDFVKRCRDAGIKIPILVGIFVPDNLRILETMLRLTKIRVDADDLEEYRHQASVSDNAFTDFAVSKGLALIDAIINSEEIEIYGFQIFTCNKFQNLPPVVARIAAANK